MDRNLEEIVKQIVEQVLQMDPASSSHLPRARLLGQMPKRAMEYTYVREGPYEAVVIGSMSGWELLQFPDPVCTEALIEGKPVLLCEEGLLYRKDKGTCSPALYSRLLTAERQMKQLGVRFLRSEEKQLLTAQDVRRLLEDGKPIHGRLTPLARDIVEAWEKGRR